jgi:hypothetical protein
MLKRFYLLATFLFLLVVLIFAHYSFSDRQQITDAINRVAGLTQMASLSLGSAYYEPRVKRIERNGNPVYPEMMSINRMDFVYAR